MWGRTNYIQSHFFEFILCKRRFSTHHVKREKKFKDSKITFNRNYLNLYFGKTLSFHEIFFEFMYGKYMFDK